MNIETLQTTLESLPLDELYTVEKLCASVINNKLRKESMRKALDLRIGQKVSFEAPDKTYRGAGKKTYTGTIEKINTTKCRVRTDTMIWNVPISILVCE